MGVGCGGWGWWEFNHLTVWFSIPHNSALSTWGCSGCFTCQTSRQPNKHSPLLRHPSLTRRASPSSPRTCPCCPGKIPLTPTCTWVSGGVECKVVAGVCGPRLSHASSSHPSLPHTPCHSSPEALLMALLNSLHYRCPHTWVIAPFNSFACHAPDPIRYHRLPGADCPGEQEAEGGAGPAQK